MTCGEKQPKMTMRTSIVRALSVSAIVALTLNPALVAASDYRLAAPSAVEGQINARAVSLGIGKSIVIDLPREIKDVLVADPKIANAVVRSAQRAYIIGAAVGQTNIVFFDAAGAQIAAYDIAVKRDLNGIRAALRQALPNADIQIDGLGDGVVLTGSASSPVEAQQAADMAARLAGSADKVVNSIAVRGRDQVMLKVTVAEVQRDVIKQLGINITGTGANNAAGGFGSAVVNLANTPPFPVYGQPLFPSAIGATWKNINATLQAMERAGVIRTLAEPNLTAISGETANFLAGGEFPIPAGYTCQASTIGVAAICQYQIQWKKFGVSLHFTPVVLAEGRISLKVLTEASELSTENQLTLVQAQGTSLSIPSIKTRQAETTVEIPSGGSLAMAGMIQEQTKQQINGIPGLMQIPILGSLFKEPRLHQQTDRIDDPDHPVRGAGCGAERPFAPR